MTHRRRTRTPTEGTVRLGTSMPIPGILRDLGVDPAEVLAEAGLRLELFDDPDNLITYAARGRLIARCVARTGCRHFGLLVGQQLGLHSLGLAGFLVRASPDVRAALRGLERLFHLHVHGAAIALAAEGDTTVLSYHSYQPHIQATDQIGDGAVAALFNVMRTLCGTGWKPDEVLFAHGRPQDLKPFRRFFDAPLRFDADQYALVFSTGWLSQPSSAADPDLLRVLQKDMQRLAVRHAAGFNEQVAGVLRTALLTGHATVGQVAMLFSMHPRTLGRRLEAAGTNFQALLDEARFEIARQMLENTALPINHIAMSLGYVRASTLTRAFRRWSGTTPGRWRMRHTGAE